MNNDIPSQEEYRAAEPDLLQGLLRAAQTRHEETKRIEVRRRGQLLFAFHVRALSEREYDECREQCTSYERNRRFAGIRTPKDFDQVRFRSLLIYTATIPEDRRRLWDNKEAWQRLGVVCGPDLVEAVLLPGEKDAIVAEIDRLSGYDQELEELVNTVGNS